MGILWEAWRVPEAEARRLVAEPDSVIEFMENVSEENVVDVDKAWHGIHWLLTGTAEPTSSPESWVIFGVPEQVIPTDLGYGPPMVLWPDDVHQANLVLATVSDEELIRRYDAAAMAKADLYPDMWSEDDILDEYLLPCIQDLRAFYQAASDTGEAVVLALV